MKRLVISSLFILAFLTPLSAEELPSDAAALKAQRDAKIAEVNRIYTTALKKLRKKHMKQGNLDGANLIAKEIASLKPKVEPSFNDAPDLKGKWIVNGKKTRSFSSKKMTDENGNKHPWSYQDGIVTITWPGGWWEKLAYDVKNPDSLKGENNEGMIHVYERVVN